MFAVAPYQIDAQTYLGYAVNYKDGELRNRIDAALECIKTKGIIAAAFEKWTGVPVLDGSMATTPVAGYGTPDVKGYEDTVHDFTCNN
jgi:polar amino acid transport system substrate-binding protein